MNETHLSAVGSGPCGLCKWSRHAWSFSDGSIAFGLSYDGPATRRDPGKCKNCREWEKLPRIPPRIVSESR